MDNLHEVWNSMQPYLAAIGGLSAVIAIVGSVSAFFGKFFADRSLEKRKLQLNQQLEDHKSQLVLDIETFKISSTQVTERLKNELLRDNEKLKVELGRDVDTFRLELKKQELLFGREIEAVSAYMDLRRTIFPESADPNLDWEEMCRRVAARLHEHVEKFGAFEVKNAPMIPVDARVKIAECKWICINFGSDGLEVEDMISAPARKAAGDMFEKMLEIENNLLASLRSWDDPKIKAQTTASES